MITWLLGFIDSRQRSALAEKMALKIERRTAEDDWFRLARFLRRGKIGTSWAPFDFGIWTEIEGLIGAKKEAFDGSGAGLREGFTESFHETSFKGLVLVARRLEDEDPFYKELRFCRLV